MPNGEMSQNDKEHMLVMHKHLKKINNKKRIDWKVLNEIKQRLMHKEIAGELMYCKLLEAIRLPHNSTAPGLNGVTSKQIKALDQELRELLFPILKAYFSNEIDIP